MTTLKKAVKGLYSESGALFCCAGNMHWLNDATICWEYALAEFCYYLYTAEEFWGRRFELEEPAGFPANLWAVAPSRMNKKKLLQVLKFLRSHATYGAATKKAIKNYRFAV